MTTFFRFPHTPHLAWLAPGAPRDDKVLSATEATALLSGKLVVEEKLDGANLGFSVSPQGELRAQNRGQYLEAPLQGQFARLTPWLRAHEDRLFDALGAHLLAFGEWCAARHSLDYVTLPDWWLLFDVHDRLEGRFWSTVRRDAWARQHGFVVVPHVYAGLVNMGQLRKLLSSVPSAFRPASLEGLVLRRENADWLEARAKLVRPDFTQTIEGHWRGRALEWNHRADHRE